MYTSKFLQTVGKCLKFLKNDNVASKAFWYYVEKAKVFKIALFSIIIC